MIPGAPSGSRKRQRVGSSTRLSAYLDPDGTLTNDPSPPPLPPPLPHLSPTPGGFNDPATADVRLRLQLDPPDPDTAAQDHNLDLHLHSSALRRSRYFDALLSDRWQHHPDPVAAGDEVSHLTLKIPATRLPFNGHIAVLRLLYTLDFSSAIQSVADALEMLPVALELLFDDCIRACVRFLEAVPWTEEEEEGVLSVIPFLRQEESRDLLDRVLPDAVPGDGKSLSEEMLHDLILSAIHSHPKVATVKAFVAKILRDYSSRDTVQAVLDRVFLSSLETVKELLGEYASPNFRVAGDNDETEAIQRLNLHAAVVNARQLLWLVERMIELRVADTAAKEWSEQAGLAADLQKTFRDDAWKNIAPGLPSLVMRCTSQLVNAIAAGSILAPPQGMKKRTQGAETGRSCLCGPILSRKPILPGLPHLSPPPLTGPRPPHRNRRSRPPSPPSPMIPGAPSGSRKRQRVGSSTRLSAYLDPDGTLTNDPSPPPLPPPLPHLSPTPGGFNDPATADVRLRLQLDPPDPDPAAQDHNLDLHLHSSALRRSRYFDALLSDRWQHHPDPVAAGDEVSHLTLKIPVTRLPFNAHVAVLRLLYTLDFSSAIQSVADALEMLPVALELLFDDCIRACVRFLEAVPWTEEEEEGVLSVIPFLRQEESRDLLDRVLPDAMPGDGKSLSEEMLHDLILSAIHSHPKVATVKAFVAKILRDYSSRDTVQAVLDRVFLSSLETVKELLGEYASPNFRVAGDNDETEAIQRLNLHAAVVNARQLLWLVERMIELRVADTAAKEWSEQAGLAADLQKTFRDDAWKNIAPGLPSLVMRCTSQLVNAIAAGSILAPRQVRMKLVKDWLPVLNVCRDIVSPISISCHKTLYQELEETFLRIISTLPMSDAQGLLQQCLSFSTRNVDDCPHLTSAFNTWFRRANRPPQDDSTS